MSQSRKVRLFVKPFCGWCSQAMDWLDEHDIQYEVLDVIADEKAYDEMYRVSGQTRTRRLLEELRLHTVCESARCPNHWECWSKGTATFMIAGDRCTRACGFCAVTTAKPFALEADEPQRVAEATRRMRLNHVVITAVARDDLPDGGAEHFRRTIDAVRALNPG